MAKQVFQKSVTRCTQPADHKGNFFNNYNCTIHKLTYIFDKPKFSITPINSTLQLSIKEREKKQDQIDNSEFSMSDSLDVKIFSPVLMHQVYEIQCD